MRPTILLAAIVTALAIACGSKKDDKAAEPGPAETPAIDKGSPGEAADETPAEPDPATASAPPVTPPVAVDCEKLLTADDLAKACGGNAPEIEVRKHAMESGAGATTCIRQAGPKANRTTSLHLAVNAAAGTPDAARALLELSGKHPGARAVAVGDGAYLVVREGVHDVEAVKGALWFKLGYQVDKGEKTPLCSDQGLVELGRTVAGRLP
jgi:type IV secretory pathway VirB10-like protein